MGNDTISIEERLRNIKIDLQKKSQIEAASDGKDFLVDALKKSKNLQEFTDIMIIVLKQVHNGKIVEVFKRNGKYVANVIPPINNLLLFSLTINAALFSIVLTKILGIW